MSTQQLTSSLPTSTLSQTKRPKCPVVVEQVGENALKMQLYPNKEDVAKNKTAKELYQGFLSDLTGTSDELLANEIIRCGAQNICSESNADKQNVILQSLADQQPKDAHEARLCAQAAALYSQGMDYLQRARGVFTESETFCKDRWHELFMKTATKLLDLHTKTVAELTHYRQRGEQRIIVKHQYVQVNDGGQAIVGSMLNGGGG